MRALDSAAPGGIESQLNLSSDKYCQAAVSYVGVGTLIVLLTVLFGIPQRKAGHVVLLLPGFVFILLFAFLIFKRFRILTMILSVLAAARTVLFLVNFFGLNIEFSFRTFRFLVHESVFVYNPVFLVNGLLMVFICFMLVRAAWDL
ncbi:MAG: hypothetical protein HY652_04535 [Acidobacteria bacterium]|nr:hypothetical protein [Acidobacteriota bacterium]